MKRPIAIGLAPNTQKKDALKAWKLFLQPGIYLRGDASRGLEKWFENYFTDSHAISFASGRGSLYAILTCLGVGSGDEVILQAFTCSAVIQAILSTGATPVFADITQEMTLSVESVEEKFTPKTKVLLLQHTFGIPADIETFQKLTNKKNIFLIEDCAHGIGGEYKNTKLGSFGGASIFSFGRDKAFSSVSGGMAITKDKTLAKKLRSFQEAQGYPSNFWVMQNLLHPVVFYFCILPLYDVLHMGKAILVLLQKIHVLSFPVATSRKLLAPEDTKKMPHALSELALLQLSRIERMNKKRKEVSQKYRKEVLGMHPVKNDSIPYLRYPIFVEDASQCIVELRKEKVYLGNWYGNVIDPKGVSLEKLRYKMGSCPQAEKIAKEIVNLPTYVSLSKEDVDQVISSINKYVTHRTNNT